MNIVSGPQWAEEVSDQTRTESGLSTEETPIPSICSWCPRQCLVVRNSSPSSQKQQWRDSVFLDCNILALLAWKGGNKVLSGGQHIYTWFNIAFTELGVLTSFLNSITYAAFKSFPWHILSLPFLVAFNP
jgi:hypothetical protein